MLSCRMCSVLVVLSTATAAVGDSGVAHGANLADLNLSIDRLTRKLEKLTQQVEEFGGAADADAYAHVDARADADVDDRRQRGGSDGRPRLGVAELEGEDAGGGGAAGDGQEEHEEHEEQEEEEEEESWAWGRDGRRFGPVWLAVGTFVHEVWLMLQHANILLNPLCQRLDRSYGVALLKRRLYWVIAGVLAAYWAREVLSMVIATPYASPLTLKMVAVSSIYHAGKILLISLDAHRRWSPTLGIMRLLMDHWHLSTLKDALLSAKRVFLQAFDTVTHTMLVRDMIRWDEESAETKLWLYRKLLIVVAVWAMHAIANLVTKMSTATLVVELAKSVLGSCGSAGGNRSGSSSASAPSSKVSKPSFNSVALSVSRAEMHPKSVVRAVQSVA